MVLPLVFLDVWYIVVHCPVNEPLALWRQTLILRVIPFWGGILIRIGFNIWPVYKGAWHCIPSLAFLLFDECALLSHVCCLSTCVPWAVPNLAFQFDGCALLSHVCSLSACVPWVWFTGVFGHDGEILLMLSLGRGDVLSSGAFDSTRVRGITLISRPATCPFARALLGLGGFVVWLY
jgi:hypothetical protein